ncbi:hypothetical protein [Amycolatopsis minnesotensis]|uniref:Phage tail protein n=1 Tax=Amycolatopsis minnesotensis TaxID=337894 RepID=A0ABP5D5Z8_9PSEU
MAIEKGARFEVSFDYAFPNGLMMMGEVAPDTDYQSGKQIIDERTGKRQWKISAADPAEVKANRASFEVKFCADVQPVPETPELAPGTGVRMVELEGLAAEPRVKGQGEYKFLGYVFWASGFKAVKSGSGSGSSSAKAARADAGADSSAKAA